MKNSTFNGSRTHKINDYITTIAISPEARDLLDMAIEQWDEHKKALPPDCQESVYSFAYWLIRYSGLVQPADSADRKAV